MNLTLIFRSIENILLILATRYDLKGDFVSQVGLAYVRGCEIEGMLDGGGRVIEEGPGPRPHVPGDTRTFRVVLDSNQYKIDLDGISKGEEVIFCKCSSNYEILILYLFCNRTFMKL